MLSTGRDSPYAEGSRGVPDKTRQPPKRGGLRSGVGLDKTEEGERERAKNPTEASLCGGPKRGIDSTIPEKNIRSS